MSANAEVAAQLPHGSVDDNRSILDDPITPPDNDILAPNSPQVTLPSTETPASPIDDANASFKTEFNDDRLGSSAIIPSSLTPPPSSQVPSHARNGALPSAYIGSQRSTLFSPPATGLATFRPAEAALATDYVPPAPQQVLEATADELRAMMQTCIAEQAKLKMEAAHHKLQYNLLSLQADEDAKRAEVEHEMARREVDALRTVEYSQHARRELSAATESAQLKYLQMKTLYEDAVDENRVLSRRFKMAKKLVSQKEDEITCLSEERDMMLNRIRENREHFTMLCNPGGMFHGAVTPSKAAQTVSTPQQARAPARQTPKSSQPDARAVPTPGQEPMAALLQALSQDNNSAPSTPIAAARPVPRLSSKHTRNTQSLSSLPTTPSQRPRGDHVGLLPSANLVPQTEPPARYSNRPFAPPSPTPRRERAHKSRESTISVVDDNEELARQALESVAKSASFLSQASRGSRGPRRPLPNNDEEDEDAVESQASQAASEMLRRDPRESFEIAREVFSGTPATATAEKSARLQAKLLSGITKNGTEKRKFSGGIPPPEDLRQVQSSPPKKLRVSTQTGDDGKVGLGIQYRCLDAIVKGAFPNDSTATAADLLRLGRRMGYSMPDFSQPRRQSVKIEDLVRAPDAPGSSSRHNSVAESRPSGSEVGTTSTAPSDAGTDEAAASGAEDAHLSLIRDTSGNEHYIGPSGTLNFLSQLRRLMVSSQGSPEAASAEVVTKFTQDDTAQALEADDSPGAPSVREVSMPSSEAPQDGPSPASVTSIAKDFTRMPAVDLDETLRGLPPDETLELLVQSYFKNVHDDYPLFHRATFEDEYELYIVQARQRLHVPMQQRVVPDWGWMGCLHMIIVFGSIANPSIPGIDHSQLRRKSVAATRTLLPQFISKCTLSNVRVLVLLSLFLHNNNERNAAWNLVGTATRISFALGLHRSDMSSSFRPLEREVRKWVFCTLYSFEQFLASSLGRPSGLQEMDVEIVPPREGFLDGGSGTDAKLVFLSLKLQAILARTRFAYARQRRPEADTQDTISKPSIDDILKSLDAWKHDVKEIPSFHMPTITTQVPLGEAAAGVGAMDFEELKVSLSWKTRSQLRAVLMLHIQYHYIAIVATRPILLREIASARKSLQDGEPPVAMSSVADACLHHAVQLTFMVLYLDGFQLVNGLSGLDVFYAYCAAMVLILRLLRRPPAPEGMDTTDSQETQIQAVIRDLVLKSQVVLNKTEKSGSMKRFASVVDAFADCTSLTGTQKLDPDRSLPENTWLRGLPSNVSAPGHALSATTSQFSYPMMGQGVMGGPPQEAMSMAGSVNFGPVTTYGAPNVHLDDGGFYFHPFNGSETAAPPEWGDMEMVMAGYGMPPR
ncbi:hypothetical protein ACHAQA_005762 [Verticillium albo-atrum]